jgi:hypothetical protein
MRIIDRLPTLKLAILVLVLHTVACTQKNFPMADNSKSSNQAMTLEPDTKANDRPTESGTGVPGYLVDCSPFSLEDDRVQVGCIATNKDGVRVTNSPSAWTRYDIRLPADAPSSVTLSKTIASNLLAWDVHFTFRGADKTTLSSIARNSIYAYSYSDAAGQTVTIETEPLPPATPVAPAAPVTAPTSCTGGAFIDGICFVPVESSCTEYCVRAAMLPHPYLISRFGNGPEIDDELNREACHDLYAKIRGNQAFNFKDTLNARGMGCYEEADGSVVYDKSDTIPSAFPRIGNRRICGCQ